MDKNKEIMDILTRAELKPCPFCGGDARIVVLKRGTSLLSPARHLDAALCGTVTITAARTKPPRGDL